MRRCSNCFQWKPDTEFYRKLEALQSRCKSCNAEVVRGYARRARRSKQDDCAHEELDHTTCASCGKDMGDELAARAEFAAECLEDR